MTSLNPASVSIFFLSAIGGGPSVYTTSWNGNTNTWSSVSTLNGQFMDQPVVVSPAVNTAALFGVGILDHALYYKAGTTAAGWAAQYTSLGGVLEGTPAVSIRGGGIMDTFHIGRDDGLYYKSYNGAAWDANFAALGGQFAPGPSPTSVSWNQSHISVFAVGLDDALYHRMWTSALGWLPYENLGGQWTGTPKAVSDQSGNIDVFGLGSNSVINHISYTNSAWSPITSLVGTWPSDPDVISWGPGRIDVFALGYDSATYHTYVNGTTAWSAWENLSGIALAPPKTVSSSPGSIFLFVIGTDAAVYYKQMAASGSWPAWTRLSTTVISLQK